MQRLLVRIARMDAHHRVTITVIVAAIAALLLHNHQLWTLSLGAYSAFAFVYLALVWTTVMLTPYEQIRAVAQRQDVGRTLIFALVVIAACAAIFAVAFLIHGGKTEMRTHFTVHLLLTITTVVFSWLLVHSLFGLRYAHSYYGDSGTVEREHRGGLSFPGERLPDYRDFAYFSFVIGMTCQVSDVQVTSRQMRRLVLLHGILSFAFNTAILALTVNIVSTVL